jgi:hypothetical protein
MRSKAVLSRIGLAERIQFTPEGYQFEDLARLIRAELQAGERVLSLTFHSPSLVPGQTPYVRNDDDLRVFLTAIRRVFKCFMEEHAGRASNPFEVVELLRTQPSMSSEYRSLATRRWS